VLNNPLRWTDPSGHYSITLDANTKDDLGRKELDRFVDAFGDMKDRFWIDSGGFAGLFAAGAAIVVTAGAAAIVIGVSAVTITVIMRDLDRMQDMLEDAQKFLSANGGGKVKMSIDSAGNVDVIAIANKQSTNGYNYFAQSTSVVFATYAMTDALIHNAGFS
jgi:hypothetical protein